MPHFSAENLVGEKKFDINKMIKIMEIIDHKWCLEDDFRVPTYQEILNTIQFLINSIEESEDFIHGKVDIPIESSLGGIHVILKMSYSNAYKMQWRTEDGHLDGHALDYRWEVCYIPINYFAMEKFE